MKEIKFSILVPIYNTDKYLRECLDSVLNQTYQNFELILVNDGSRDLSEKICNEYKIKDDRIKLFTQENQGHLMTRKRASLEAKGDYYVFLDSDDYWDTNLLEEVYNSILETNSDLIIYKYKLVSEESVYISESKGIFSDKTIFNQNSKKLLFEEVLKGPKLNNLVCKVFKNNLAEKIDYCGFETIKNGEDLIQSLPLMYYANKVIYIDKCLYNYRTVQNSITHTFNMNLYRDISIVRELVLMYIKRLNMDDKNSLIIFYKFYLECIINYIIQLINNSNKYTDIIESFNNIKQYKIYIDSLKYSKKCKLKAHQNMLLWLFQNNLYRTLFIITIILSKLHNKLYCLYNNLKGNN